MRKKFVLAFFAMFAFATLTLVSCGSDDSSNTTIDTESTTTVYSGISISGSTEDINSAMTALQNLFQSKVGSNATVKVLYISDKIEVSTTFLPSNISNVTAAYKSVTDAELDKIFTGLSSITIATVRLRVVEGEENIVSYTYKNARYVVPEGTFTVTKDGTTYTLIITSKLDSDGDRRATLSNGEQTVGGYIHYAGKQSSFISETATQTTGSAFNYDSTKSTTTMSIYSLWFQGSKIIEDNENLTFTKEQ